MEQEIKELRNLVTKLIIKVDELTIENNYLRSRLSKYEHPKNSNNSSVPPSKDENKPKRKSLREKSGLKPGGQKGRKGKTLTMVENPDIIQKHIPEYCNCCDADLQHSMLIPFGKRQMFDIPKIKIQVTEHQVNKKQCSCGHITEAAKPSLSSPNIRATVSLFKAKGERLKLKSLEVWKF